MKDTARIMNEKLYEADQQLNQARRWSSTSLGIPKLRHPDGHRGREELYQENGVLGSKGAIMHAINRLSWTVAPAASDEFP